MDSISIPGKPASPPPAPEPSQPSSKAPKKPINRELISTFAVIISAPIIAILLTVFVFQSYEVDGPSMETTLQHRDRLIVSKVGKTWSKITRKDFMPKRYQVVIFDYQEGGVTENKQLIKRVIGLPGDRVVVRDGVTTIYNDQHPKGFNPDKEGPEVDVITSTEGNIDITIGEGEVFVMGDNRPNSKDSRYFGPIDTSDIVGVLHMRIYPFDKIQRF